MLNNFLVVTSENAANGYPKHIGIGEAAIDALLGFLVVFIGIALLVGIIWLVGYIMRKVSGKAPQKAEKKQKPAVVPKETPVKESDGLSEEEVAVITAAIMAYYAKEKPKCEFTVKRIKRIEGENRLCVILSSLSMEKAMK